MARFSRLSFCFLWLSSVTILNLVFAWQIQSNLYNTNTLGTTQNCPSWKDGGLIQKTYIKPPRTKFSRSWQVLGFFPAVNVLKEIEVYLNKDLQFGVLWSHSRRLKMFSITFDFECTYIKEVQYNCSARDFAHLFIIETSSHNHKERKESHFFFNVATL